MAKTANNKSSGLPDHPIRPTRWSPDRPIQQTCERRDHSIQQTRLRLGAWSFELIRNLESGIRNFFLCLSLLVSLGACAPADQSERAGTSSSLPEAANWEQIVAAAKQEGKVVVSGPTRELWRSALASFAETYPEIQVEYVGANSRDFWPRVFRERELGQYLWDLRVGGPDPQVFEARDRGVLDPIRPFLLLPEVTDETKWFGGMDRLFFDREKKYALGFVSYISYVGYVNRDVIPDTELKSLRDLADPRWKGKIVLQDPRGGAGLSALEMMLEVYGEDLAREILTKQDVVVANDLRQQAEWLIRGRYPIALGIVPDAFLAFEDQGVPVNIRPIPEERSAIATGTGGIQLFNRAPHSNAAKVYINWLLTREVQARLSAATRMNSRRLDVPTAHSLTAPDPAKLESYIPTQVEEMVPVRQQAQQLARELLP